VPHTPLINPSLTRKRSPPGHGTVRAIHSAGKTNIRVKHGFPRRLTNGLCSPKCQYDPWHGLNARARGQLLRGMDSLKILLSAELLAFRYGFYFLEGHSFGSGRAAG